MVMTGDPNESRLTEERAMRAVLKRLLSVEEGQAMTEYALIFGLIVFGIWVTLSVTGIGASIKALFSNVQSEIPKCSVDKPGCGANMTAP
jgi:Flp pilus assembly pilin Flp